MKTSKLAMVLVFGLLGCAVAPVDQQLGESTDALAAKGSSKIIVRTRAQLLGVMVRANGGTIPPVGHYEPKPEGRPCSWLNGKRFYVDMQGPDGGTCGLTTQNTQCQPAPQDGLCECGDIIISAIGDCTKNGDAASVIDPRGI